MFQINFHHQSPEVIVKRSSVARAATFTGVTQGVAVKYVSPGREQYAVGKERQLPDAGEFLQYGPLPLSLLEELITKEKP